VPKYTINTVTTNVGPQFPLHMLRHHMIEAYPFVPIFGSLRISIAIFSYLEGLNFGVTADYESAPDIEVLCDGIEASIQEYSAIAGAVGGEMAPGMARQERRALSHRGRQPPGAKGQGAATRALNC
jgi:hypothetical protein